jgi:sortase B
MDYSASSSGSSHLSSQYDSSVSYPADLNDNDIDWAYWSSVNSDLVGWIYIPDTHVDYPIVQAQESDPEFYLTHDIYKNWNYCGCPYLDAADAPNGLNSLNCVIFGHNLGWNQLMFGDFEYYPDPSFAENHRTIYIYTPSDTKVLTVAAASIIDGSSNTKRTAFSNPLDLNKWFVVQFNSANMSLDPTAPTTTNLFTFCTCSYGSNNERTITYACK